MAVKSRTYTVPSMLASAFSVKTVTLDDLEVRRHIDSPSGIWARRVLSRECNAILSAMIGRISGQMPYGLTDPSDPLLVTGLFDQDLGVMIAGGVWVDPTEEHYSQDLMELAPDDVAFVARAFYEGAESVLFRPYIPHAWIPVLAAGEPVAAPPMAKNGLPANALPIAIVDDVDRNAVLELLIITPGPFLFRRNNGKWEPDDNLLAVLKSVKPPPTVRVSDDVLPSVIAQVDEATAGEAFEPSGRSTVLGSSDALALERIRLSLTADAASKVKGKGYDVAGAMPPHLKKYWTVGRGAAKIRWGTPGAMTRCHRHLLKFVGSQRAYETCNNLGKVLGGKGVAWDVLHRSHGH
jgi:hypothetical protein